jgi:hypothetical protein
VGEVWLQLEAEVAHPELPAASAPELLLHMLALQAEGLPLAQVGAGYGRGRREMEGEGEGVGQGARARVGVCLYARARCALMAQP